MNLYMDGNMYSKIRIAICVSSLTINGISNVIFSYLQKLDMSKFSVTILSGMPVDKRYSIQAQTCNVNIVELPKRKRNPIYYYYCLYKNIKNANFDIFHIHGNSSSMFMELLIARIAGIKSRIAHSHNTTCDFKAHSFFNPLFKKMYTEAFACGEDAGRFLFGKDSFFVMRNGFEVKRFVFSESIRNETRALLGYENSYIIGHIGRINHQKNQEYLIDVFEIVASKRGDAILLLIGTGPDEAKIKAKAELSLYKDRIIFAGETDFPEKMYMAMDIMAFPSRHEGLPITLIEAQITGLPCVIADTVTLEVCFSKEVRRLPINVSPDVWADTILNSSFHANRNRAYNDYYESIGKYDIDICVKDVEKKYYEIVSKK